MDTPSAIAHVWDVVKDQNISNTEKLEALTLADTILGLGLSDERAAAKLKVLEQNELPEEVQTLVEAREAARKAKDFAESDKLREKIAELGFEVKDTPQGQSVTRL